MPGAGAAKSPRSICTSPRKTPPRLAEQIRACRGHFPGQSHTPVALGDYAAGPSQRAAHQLAPPRFASGLFGSNDFLLRREHIAFSRRRALGNWHLERAGVLATKEGLTGHRASVEYKDEG